MSEIKKKLTVAAVETTTTAAAAATAVAIAAASPTAGVLAAIPIMAKTVVECLLDSKRAAESRQLREKEFFEEFHRQIEAVMRKIAEVAAEAERTRVRSLKYDEVLILVEQFFDQAMKAPKREKRLLLAAAAAGKLSARRDHGHEIQSSSCH